MAINVFRGPGRRAVNLFNAGALALAAAPVVGPRIRRHITTISYTGRKSGRRFSLPVGYRRDGDTVTIRVEMAQQKTWWRNFSGAGAPMTIELEDGPHHGLAVSRPDGRRAVVTLKLDP
ncbi:MAG TPA: hypothetical protein VFW21_04025 [Mycobacterium sp.]|nr:hypothetical protein [Mycobacterium sp.]